jgi:hypothetical protein
MILCEWFPKTPTHEVGSRANFHLYDVNVAATRIHEESMHRGPDSNDGLEGVLRVGSGDRYVKHIALDQHLPPRVPFHGPQTSVLILWRPPDGDRYQR